MGVNLVQRILDNFACSCDTRVVIKPRLPQWQSFLGHHNCAKPERALFESDLKKQRSLWTAMGFKRVLWPPSGLAAPPTCGGSASLLVHPKSEGAQYKELSLEEDIVFFVQAEYKNYEKQQSVLEFIAFLLPVRGEYSTSFALLQFCLTSVLPPSQHALPF